MRAVEIQEYGGPEVLRVVETEAPTPGPGQVSIDVAYTGVNFADLKARADGYRVPALPFVPGLEASGRVRALGAGVTGLAVGQQVAALTQGGAYADVVVADAVTVFPLPPGVDLRTGATLPTVLPTAYALIHTVGRLQPGETVLVQGAAGGVGTVLGQLASAAGAGAVLGVVSSEAKAEYAREHGYDEVFVTSSTTPSFAKEVREATGGRGVDLALDPVGGETLRASLDSLAPFGRLVSFGNASGAQPWQVGQPDLYPLALSVSGFSILTLAQTSPTELRALTERAFRTVVDGVVSLPVTAEFALPDAAEAHRLMGTRTSTGKLLLRAHGTDGDADLA
ncbi:MULTISPECIES: zinc-binding dehydrogenase [unclassified Streptomyces]|uniref:quinone oxidoreductase family protein n=1 Tax=unclassified Streptomyces TaxID=2593676 RepID=UPI0011627840|nr:MULTISPECIES: zinc-binding dehydrogenase [unclassified Streptomyces]NMI60125.1 zinc-binding dehydrogenase [Streptomyces sp. RLA2-12]QDN59324.1 zinc-binding dehydrogenase [Streptomyces sp. S1D4-20]QDN69400.1 zinc-binding dehydrogenase [Streptomyces sp. S1D4-14]QDO51890.1 zinc-binding dehydrogenase [Streptomyces sp. RLB3-5]QDO62132.1 zinc-binding dehydrogenase [Streptomyces sp. RLB1-8]